MKRIILSIKRNRTWNVIKARLQAEKAEAQSSKDNHLDDLSDLHVDEYNSMLHWVGISFKSDVIRSSFNLDHFRKVKEARLSSK